MPIKPENRKRYPPDWSEITWRILCRANHRCEGSPAYPDCRAENRKMHPVTWSMVVLTIGHINHVPEDVRDENLRAWCQRCHLTYDAKHHAETARQARMRRKAMGDLFEGEYEGEPDVKYVPSPLVIPRFLRRLPD